MASGVSPRLLGIGRLDCLLTQANDDRFAASPASPVLRSLTPDFPIARSLPNHRRSYWALVWRGVLAVVAMVSAVIGRWRGGIGRLDCLLTQANDDRFAASPTSPKQAIALLTLLARSLLNQQRGFGRWWGIGNIAEVIGHWWGIGNIAEVIGHWWGIGNIAEVIGRWWGIGNIAEVIGHRRGYWALVAWRGGLAASPVGDRSQLPVFIINVLIHTSK